MKYKTSVCNHLHKSVDRAINCARTARHQYHEDFYKDIYIRDENGTLVEVLGIWRPKNERFT